MTDVARDLQNLASVFQQASAGSDVRGSFTSVARMLGRVQQQALRRMCFQLLVAAASDDSQWYIVLNGAVSDTSSADPSARAHALRTIAQVPPHVILSNFESVKSGVFECFSHPQPIVRSAAVQLVHSLFLLNIDMLRLQTRNEVPVEPSELWSLVVDALTDSADEVAVPAFQAVADMIQFMTEDVPLWRRDEAPDCLTTFKFAMSTSYKVVCELTVARLPALIQRAQAVSVEIRDPCLRVTSSLVLAGPVPSVLQTPSADGDLVDAFPSSSSDTQALAKVDAYIDNALIPVMSDFHIPLVVEACKQAIRLLTHRAVLSETNRGQLKTAVEALLRCMERSESAPYFNDIEKGVTTVLHLLDPLTQIEILPQLLQGVQSLKTVRERSLSIYLIAHCVMNLSTRTTQRHLHTVEEFQRARAAGGGGKLPTRPMTELQLFLTIDLVKSVWENNIAGNVYREEIAGALCTVMCHIGEHDHRQGNVYSPAWLSVALDLAEGCQDVVTWDTQGRNFAADALFTLLAKLAATQRNDPVGLAKDNPSSRVQHILSYIIQNFEKIPSAAVETRAIWLISEHLLFDWDKGASGERFVALIKRRLLRIDIVESQRRVLAKARQSGVMTSAPGHAAPKGPAHAPVILQCILRFGLRLPTHMESLFAALQDLMVTVSTDSGVGDSVRDSLERIARRLVIVHEARRAGSMTNDVHEEILDTHFPPPWELYNHRDPCHIIDRTFGKIGRQVEQVVWGPRPLGMQLARTPALERDPEYRSAVTEPVTLSGPSDAVALRIHHVTNPKRLRITLHVTVMNMTPVALEGVHIHLGLEGEIDFAEATTVASHTIKLINAGEKGTWEVSLEVTGFARQVIHPTVYFEAAASGASGSVQSRRSRTTVHCAPYPVHVNDFLLPEPLELGAFMQTWSALSASLHSSCTLRQQHGALGNLVRALMTKPFSLVTARAYGNDMFFQLAFTATTWFKEPLFFTGTGSFDTKSQRWICRFEFRSSSERCLKVLDEQFASWFSDLCGPAVQSDTDSQGSAVDNSTCFNSTDVEFAMPPALLGNNQIAVFDRWQQVRQEIGVTSNGPVEVSTSNLTPLPQELCEQFVVDNSKPTQAARLQDEAAAVADKLRASVTSGARAASEKASEGLARLSNLGGRFKGLSKK